MNIFLITTVLFFLVEEHEGKNFTKNKKLERRNTNESFNINIGAGYGVQTDNQSNQNNHQPQPNEDNLTTNILTPNQPLEAKNNHQAKNGWQNYQEEQFYQQQHLPSQQDYYNYNLNFDGGSGSYQVHEPSREIEEKSFDVKPNLNELESVVNNLDKRKTQGSKIVQVLKVPAVYEIHLQSDMPSVGKHYININSDQMNHNGRQKNEYLTLNFGNDNQKQKSWKVEQNQQKFEYPSFNFESGSNYVKEEQKNQPILGYPNLEVGQMYVNDNAWQNYQKKPEWSSNFDSGKNHLNQNLQQNVNFDQFHHHGNHKVGQNQKNNFHQIASFDNGFGQDNQYPLLNFNADLTSDQSNSNSYQHQQTQYPLLSFDIGKNHADVTVEQSSGSGLFNSNQGHNNVDGNSKRPFLEPIIKHHFTKSQNMENLSWRNTNKNNQNYFHSKKLNFANPKFVKNHQGGTPSAFSHVSIKHHHSHPSQEQIIKTNPIPQNTVPPSNIDNNNFNFESNFHQPQSENLDFLDTSRKPQALHVVPAPVLGGDSPPNQNAYIQQSQAYSATPNYSYEVQETSQSFNSQPTPQPYLEPTTLQNLQPQVNQFTTFDNQQQQNQNLVYGKQIEVVQSPQSPGVIGEAPTTTEASVPSWVPDEMLNEHIQKLLDIDLGANSNQVVLPEQQNSPSPGEYQASTEASTPDLSLYFANRNQQGHSGQSQQNNVAQYTTLPVEVMDNNNVYSGSQMVNNIYPGMQDNYNGFNGGEIIYGEKIGAKKSNRFPQNFASKNEARPFKKQQQRRRNDNLVDYIIYITEKTLD